VNHVDFLGPALWLQPDTGHAPRLTSPLAMFRTADRGVGESTTHGLFWTGVRWRRRQHLAIFGVGSCFGRSCAFIRAGGDFLVMYISPGVVGTGIVGDPGISPFFGYWLTSLPRRSTSPVLGKAVACC